MLFDINKIV